MTNLNELRAKCLEYGAELEIDRDEKTVQIWSAKGTIFNSNGCSRICHSTHPAFPIAEVYRDALDDISYGITEAEPDGVYWWTDCDENPYT